MGPIIGRINRPSLLRNTRSSVVGGSQFTRSIASTPSAPGRRPAWRLGGHRRRGEWKPTMHTTPGPAGLQERGPSSGPAPRRSDSTAPARNRPLSSDDVVVSTAAFTPCSRSSLDGRNLASDFRTVCSLGVLDTEQPCSRKQQDEFPVCVCVAVRMQLSFTQQPSFFANTVTSAIRPSMFQMQEVCMVIGGRFGGQLDCTLFRMRRHLTHLV